MIIRDDEKKEAELLDQKPDSVPESEITPNLATEESNPAMVDQSSHENAVDTASSETAFDPSNDITNLHNGLDTIKQMLDKMAKDSASLESQFSTLQEHFDSKIRYDESKEKMIDTMHKELQAYRDGLHYQHIRPLAMGLIDLHDDLESILAYQANQNQLEESADVNRMKQNLEVTRDSIKTILEENGVVAFSGPGEVFERKRQRVQRTEPTDNPELAGRVCERLHMGFDYGDIVMRPEVVSTWKYIPKQETLK